jgi:nicotianamine synthase
MGGARVGAAIEAIHAGLAARPNLKPDPATDRLFRRLVALVTTAPAGTPVAPAVQAALPGLCAEGEHELERAWAARIAVARRPAEELARFPYADNYVRLTRLELATLRRLGVRPRRVLFVGAGSLPLSPLLLSAGLGVAVDALDRDPHAVAAAQRVVGRLEGGAVTAAHGELAAAGDLGRYDLVVLAALVGMTPAVKAGHVARLAGLMRPGAVLLARSARGLRTLLYPPVDTAALGGFDLRLVVHPRGAVLNSVVVARRTVVR